MVYWLKTVNQITKDENKEVRLAGRWKLKRGYTSKVWKIRITRQSGSVFWCLVTYNQNILELPPLSLESVIDFLSRVVTLGKIEGKDKGGSRGWDGWRASPTQRAWIWANSGRQWRTGKPVVRQCMRLQRIRRDLVTEQQQHAECSLL